ncbi:hypothetical protein ABZ863_22335 [Saccharomonospora sp. NPDC046836]|uniref:hypothetical protein n=1 Tax=Saccharomonospora sp. NPDC046836 TaxID=3156921 RepID=UPI0033D46A07
METATRDEATTSDSKPWLMRLGIGLFAIGMLAVVVVFILFAVGFQDLPVWLSAAAGVITPLGLLLGLAALVREHRKG